ncbi:MAG: class I SAM-dependent rRNA methyltransferase [Elusimicrobia bacterium]|nr:class I SAM-dependent rRNA methyltransferase [Elusimicrobiota bacterium]MBU2614941.1 class I SAM-dependent rRNA methyltransferase [Elusimicrobiota bacterium]
MNINARIVTLKQERSQRIIQNRHPWVFSGAIENVSKGMEDGEIASIADTTGKIFAQGAYNLNSDIRLRIMSWKTEEKIADDWFSKNVKNLAKTKEKLLGISSLSEEKKNYRLVFSECDNIPGLVIDRYGLIFVIQLHTLFADKKRELWISIIKQLWNPVAIYERSDIDVRKKEGLATMPTGILHGKLPEKHIIEEDGLKAVVDIRMGQKTGYFLDLRQVRNKIEKWCKNMDVKFLQNYFGYTGSFNQYAARAGVEKIEHIDSSDTANEIAKENAKLNGFGNRIRTIHSDIYEYLTQVINDNVDAIVLDPPSFVKSKDKIRNALEGYKRLNSIAMKKLKSSGILFSLSCSSYVSEDDFQKMLFNSAISSGCKIKVLEKFGHDVDHAWPLTFPEGRYLQCWILQKQ